MARHDQPVLVRRKRQAALLGVAEAEAAGVADGAHRQDELVDLQQSGAGPTGRGRRWADGAGTGRTVVQHAAPQ
jgi:hypothetical protein